MLNMNINEIKKRAIKEIKEAESLDDLENLRIKILGRKGELTQVLRSLKDLSLEKRKKLGSEANKAKKEISSILNEQKTRIESKEMGSGERIDVTAPGKKKLRGNLHPISHILKKTEDFFTSMSFEIVRGPDVETDYYNFDALNIPKDHPARDMWDTFWLKGFANKLLRTHTSPMQVRYMERKTPPFKIIVPGRTFRYEATDASHSHTFYQVEGLVVDRSINIANFKAVIKDFLKSIFGENVEMRIRPGYFPFTEPSFEIDMRQEGGDWLEILGAGMVHPNVFKAAGYIPREWQGFAFGVGIDRIVKLKYKIDDIRLLYSGDLRFLNQF
ncbi:MAG: phenylalanine--tRNA ligase subunit alpha [Candidatus Portnoybacteria bacterium]|nr:phenylalanine--tRNA ligase subunit alpha [Candidatus Portnoybacteria bacterium]